MKIYEISTGYTTIPAKISAATEIVVEELTKAFLDSKVPVEIIDMAANNRAKNQLPIREVKIPKLFVGTDVHLGIMHKLKRVVYSVSLAFELKRILKETNETVVFHFHNQYNLFFFLKLVPKALRKKSIVAYTNHSGIWRLGWSDIQGIIKKRYFQEAECMKRADIVFLLNKETKYNIMKHLGVQEERINLICNGVNTEIYHPLTNEEKERAKEKWNLKNRRVILQVGSVCENKGQLRSVEYLLPLLKEQPDLVFAYAGGIIDQEYQDKLLCFAKENQMTDQIRYLGMLSPGKDLNELYNTALLTILPSRYEAFSLVVIESLAAGVPMLFDQASLMCIGEGTIAYECDSVISTVKHYVYDNAADYAKLCTYARENAVDHYGWKKIGEDYLTALVGVAEDRK